MRFSLASFYLPFWLRCWRYIVNKFALVQSYVRRLLYREPSDQQESCLVNLSSQGYLDSTAVFFRVQPGVVLKAPVTVHQDETIRLRPSVFAKLEVEQRVLEKLGEHPRIVRFLGRQGEFPTGLLFSEAEGSLQRVLDEQGAQLPAATRSKWSLQAIEAVTYIHQQGVWHCDLRPDNFLVHGPGYDLRLCDFGGATCKELDISGGQLPDAGFFDPVAEWDPSPAIDIFSLGSVLYFISTGHWPFREPGGQFESLVEMEAYEAHVESQLRRGSFPSTEHLPKGHIILGCWRHQFSSMDEVVAAFNTDCT